jgi:hypothetical protein
MGRRGQWPRGDASKKSTGGRRQLLGGAALAGAVLATGFADRVAAVDGQDGRSIVGAWLVLVPQPDGSSYETVQIYTTAGVTLSLFSPGGTGLNERPSLGAGVWKQTGEATVSFSFVAPLYDPGGHAAGRARVQGDLTISEGGDEASGPVRTSIEDPDAVLREQTSIIAVTATPIAPAFLQL